MVENTPKQDEKKSTNHLNQQGSKSNNSRNIQYLKTLSFPICVFLSLLSGTLMILSFPTIGWYLLAFIGWVPILFVIETQGLLKSTIAIIIFIFLFYYYLLDWISVFHAYAVPGLILYVIIIHFVPLLIYRLFRKSQKFGSLYNALLFATIMVIFEFMREQGFPKFSYGSIAYTQYRFTSFIQIADIVGFLGISYIIYFINACIAGSLMQFFFNKENKSKLFFCKAVIKRFILIGILLMVILWYGNKQLNMRQNLQNNLSTIRTIKNQTNQKTEIAESTTRVVNEKSNVINSINTKPKQIRVSLIQPWYDYNLKWTKENRELLLKKLFRLTREAAKDKPDLIIWPESAIIDYYEYRLTTSNKDAMAFHYKNFFEKFGKENPDIYFLSGALSLSEVNDNTLIEKKVRTAKDAKTGSLGGNIKKYNSALLINDLGEVVDKSAKMFLVPVGEYFPYKNFLKAIPWFENILEEAQASDFTPFEKIKVLNFPKAIFSTLICYEDTFESLSRTLVLHGSQFLVLITNDAWSYSVKSQEIHYMFSVFRAIENRRHVLRVGNAGVTGIIDPWGETDNVLPMFEEAYTTVQFTPNAYNLSLFTQYGNFFIVFLVIVFIFLIYYSIILKVWLLILFFKKRLLKLFIKKS